MVARRMNEKEAQAGSDSALNEAGGVLTIDLGAVVANWRELARRASGARCAAVVKADGYGLGLEQVARALAAAGCDTFFVALLDEARRLRAALPAATIYVLDGLNRGTADEYLKLRVAPVLGSLSEIEEWDALARKAGVPCPAAIHVDTGMNRLGLSVAQAKTANERKPGFQPSLIMSHLACADEPAHPLNRKQIEAFRQVAQLFPRVPASLANSAGLLMDKETHFDLVRPGIALYGGRAVLTGENPMQPVVQLKLRILQVREAAAGETVGYGAGQQLKRPSRLAICAAGYADGIFRAVGGSDAHSHAEAIVAGRRCPLVGRVSMDLLAIDVTDIPPDKITRGDFATLLGDGISVDEFARHAGTIGYETLTSLGRRYARIYRGG
jgi:alanine racemase